jgi:hypothetical protein
MDQLQRIRQISARDFMTLGVGDVAYIKPAVVQDKLSYVIFSADGTILGAAEDRDVAFAAVRQQGLEPMSAH